MSRAARPACVRRARRGFTLLEAVLAMAILSSVLVVALGVRAQSMSLATRLDADRRALIGQEELFAMVLEGLLPLSQNDARSRTRTWSGEHMGLPYLIVATPVDITTPLPEEVRGTLAPGVVMFRYTLTYAGRESEVLWHR